jgi:hypothetical protein
MNASDTWLNVRVFVAGTETTTPMTMEHPQASRTEHPQGSRTPATPEFVTETTMQVKPGGTTTYKLTRNPNYSTKGMSLVHVQVEPVTPTWMPPARQFWLELLTPPPVTIVATGTGEALKFNTGQGAVAVIPEREIEGGRFEHKVVGVPEEQQ